MKKFTAALFILLIVGIGFYSYANHNARTNPINTPTERPEFSLPDLNGKTRSISEWDGQYVVVNFWATWCPPCRKEIPGLVHLQNTYSNQGLQIVGVAIDDEEAVRQYAFEMDINYPNLVDVHQDFSIARSYGNLMGALPYSVIINPEKKIIYRHTGLLTPEMVLKVTQLKK